MTTTSSMSGVLGGPARAAQLALVHEALLSSTRVRILELIDKNGPLVPQRVADAIGCAEHTAVHYMNSLRDAGLIARAHIGQDQRALPGQITPFGRHCLWFAQQVIR